MNHMRQLRGTRTHTNLKEAFAGEPPLPLLRAADIQGHPDVAGLFKNTAGPQPNERTAATTCSACASGSS
jgi:hypothetical protein